MLRGESGRILRDLFEFGGMTAGEVMVPRVRLVGIPAGTDVDELRQIIRAQPAHPLSGPQRRLGPHCRQRARQGAAAAPGREPAGRRAATRGRCRTCRRPCRWTSAGGDAAQPGAHGGGDGRARRHGGRRDHRRPVRRSGRRHRPRAAVAARCIATPAAGCWCAAPSGSRPRATRSVWRSSTPRCSRSAGWCWRCWVGPPRSATPWSTDRYGWK